MLCQCSYPAGRYQPLAFDRIPFFWHRENVVSRIAIDELAKF
jgi:hypothetical protein